jgi:DNA-binding transcriptional MerR regulator
MENNSEDEQLISIGDLSRAIGITTRTIRYYEEMGIISSLPRRLEGGIRAFTASETGKLKYTLRLKELGLTIKEIQELNATYAEASETTKIIPRMVEMFDFHINKLDEKMSKLASLRKEIVDYRHKMIERFQLNKK